MKARKKMFIFDHAVAEIERLLYVSVLDQFYESSVFNEINLSRMNSNGAVARSSAPTVTPWNSAFSKMVSVNTVHVDPTRMATARSDSDQLNPESVLNGYNKRTLSLFDAVSTTDLGPNERAPPFSPRQEEEQKSRATIHDKLMRSKSMDSDDRDHRVNSNHAALSAAVLPKASAMRTVGTISTESEVTEPPSNVHVCAMVSSPGPPSGIRPYRHKRPLYRIHDGTPPILVNLSHSTESVFSFEYGASPTMFQRRRSGSTTLVEKASERQLDKISERRHFRRRTSPSNTSSPRLLSLTSIKSPRLLSPSSTRRRTKMGRSPKKADLE